MPGEFRPENLVAVLVEHEIEFILVGGVAAIVHGAPVMTADLDVVYDPAPDNLRRLIMALESIHAMYRDPAGRSIAPSERRLAEARLNLLVTDLGPLDLMQRIGDDLGYKDLKDKTEIHVLDGHRVRVLALETIIETKEYADRPKDRYALPFLREVLDRQRDKG